SRELEDPKVWDDQKKAQELGREKKLLEGIVVNLREIDGKLKDGTELFELAKSEADDETLRAVAGDVVSVEDAVARLEFQRMFNHPLDPANTFIDINAGSGGTEAQDWASMLMRMYLRYCERKGYA